MNHDQWLDFAEYEYERMLQVLHSLTPDEWESPTDCAGWTVRDIVAHVVGAAQSTASIRESFRQMRLSRQHPGEQLVDRINEVQLAERRVTAPDALVSELANAAVRSIRNRRRTPGLIRRAPVPTDTPGLGRTTLGYLNDTVYTRDVWMHRVDICRATGHELTLTAAHDGRLVADAADEWLTKSDVGGVILTGPAGGRFGTTRDDPLRLDAVEFCRALSGRAALDQIRPDLVPF